ncbi:pyrophosphatase [Microbacterium sp. HJ5]
MEVAIMQHEVEAVSALYAERFDVDRTDDWLILKLNEEVGELTKAYLARTGQTRNRDRTADEIEHDFQSELADTLAHVLLIAERFGADLTAAVQKKWLAWNATR